MSDERELAQQLLDQGFAVGRSKKGRLLRVDCRGSGDPPQRELVSKIVSCEKLRELYLPGLTGCLNDCCDRIAGLQFLQVLDVEGSDLTNESADQLVSCPTLSVLNVRDTCVTPERVDELRKVMIGTRIIF